MSINAIQFQRGLSLPQFQALYGSERQCERCSCRCPLAPWLAVRALRLQTLFPYPQWHGPTAVGVFHLWLPKLIYRGHRDGAHPPAPEAVVPGHVPAHARQNAISALALKRQLGVSYKTAWLMKRKLMQAMAQRDERYLLQGRVEIDDAYLGGERAGQRAGSQRRAPSGQQDGLRRSVQTSANRAAPCICA